MHQTAKSTFLDRTEWSRGWVRCAAVWTLGAPFSIRRNFGPAEALPFRSISGIGTDSSGFRATAVKIAALGVALAVRLLRAEAAEARMRISKLILT
jgi:hypothetical protein